MPYIYLTSIEMDSRDQPVFIAAGIEDEEVSNSIGRWECTSKLRKIHKIASFHQLNPPGKRHFIVGVPFPEFA